MARDVFQLKTKTIKHLEKKEKQRSSQGWVIIFVSGHICGLRAKFQSKRLIQSQEMGLRGSDVARGPYIAPKKTQFGPSLFLQE